MVTPVHPEVLFRCGFPNPWHPSSSGRTARSIFGCTNLFLCFLCIRPSMLHIYLHEVALVMTEHNFFVNHVRLSNKTCPFSSMTSSMKVFTQVWWDLLMFRYVKAPSGWSCCFSSDRSYFFALISSCQDTKAGPNVAECFVHVEVSTVHRCVKDIPPSHEQGMLFATRGFRETVNRFTVLLVQDQAQIVQDIRGFTFHTVVDTQSLQHRFKDLRGFLDQFVRDSPVGPLVWTRSGDVVVYLDNFTFPLVFWHTIIFRDLHVANRWLTLMFTTVCYLRGHVTLDCKSPEPVCFATKVTLGMLFVSTTRVFPDKVCRRIRYIIRCIQKIIKILG